MTIKDLEKTFRIELKIDNKVSLDAVRQFLRVMNNVYENKKIYQVTSPSGKTTYHATMSDIVKFLISQGFVGAQIQNIHMAVQSGTRAYSHSIECILINDTTIVESI